MEGLTFTFPVNGSRPKQTCKQCRIRKVKCKGGDRGDAPCNNCERLHFACSFRSDSAPRRDTSSSSAATAATAAASAEATTPADANEAAAAPEVAPPELDWPEPRRVSKACARCREHKVRCSGGNPCSACRQKDSKCEYSLADKRRPTKKRRVDHASPPSSHRSQRPRARRPDDEPREQVSSSSSSSARNVSGHQRPSTEAFSPQVLTPADIARQSINQSSRSSSSSTPTDPASLVTFFFTDVYPLPSYSFFHPSTTQKRFAQGRLEPCLVYALAAAASVRSPPPQRRPRLEPVWAERVETFIWQHLESPSLARLQATLLVILFRIETGQLRRAFMLCALAGRAAAAMRLNHERPEGNRSSLEVRHRLMWSLKLVERYFTVGLPEFELCPVENLYIQLPCCERDFGGDDADVFDTDDQSAYHICIELEMLRRDIMKLTRSLALCEEPYPLFLKVVRDFRLQLERIGDQLPGGRQLSSESIKALLDNRWLARHLLMRLSWHECFCDLYRLLLKDFREAAPQVILDSTDPAVLDAAEDTCIHHCRAILHILATVNNESPRPRPIEFDSAVCGYNASRLILFTARFGHTASRPGDDFAVSHAELCLAALQRFFPDKKLVQPILVEIRRLINEFLSAGTPAPSRLTSPQLTAAQQAQDPARRLSSAAKVRQHLAIHSLLRQAGFSDEDDEPDEADQLPDAAPPKPAFLADDMAQASLPPIRSLETTAPPMEGDFQLDETTPDTQVDSEPWRHDFFAGGDLLHGLEFDNYAAATPSLHHRSFTFPWLQRDQ